MGLISLREPWGVQPQVPAGAKAPAIADIPLARGLQYARVATTHYGLKQTAAPAIVGGRIGQAWQGNGSSSFFFEPSPFPFNPGVEHTILALVEGVPAADRRCFTLADASTTIIQIGSGTADASKGRLFLRSSAGDLGGTTATTAVVFEADKPHMFALNYDGAGTLQAYVDGASDASVTSTAATNANISGEAGLCALVRNSAGAVFASNKVYMALFWQRALTAAEHRELWANPWVLFRERQIYVSAAIAAGANVFNPISGRGGAAAQPIAVH